MTENQVISETSKQHDKFLLTISGRPYNVQEASKQVAARQQPLGNHGLKKKTKGIPHLSSLNKKEAKRTADSKKVVYFWHLSNNSNIKDLLE